MTIPIIIIYTICLYPVIGEEKLAKPMKCPVPIYIHVIINNTINMLNKSNFTLKEHLIALVAMKCSALRQLCTPLNCLLDRPLYVHCRDLGLVKPLPKATGILSSLL